MVGPDIDKLQTPINQWILYVGVVVEPEAWPTVM